MGKFWEFLKAVFSHWEPVVSGISFALLLWVISLLYEKRTGSNILPWYVYVFVALAFVFYGCYRAWLDQDQRLQEAHQKIAALKDELEAQVDDTLREVVIGQNSGLTPFAKLSYLQRREYYVRLDLENAAPEDKPTHIKKLIRTLTQQLELGSFQRPSTRGQDQFSEIVRKLEELHALVKEMKL